MKKRFFSVLLALALCLGLAVVPSSAAVVDKPDWHPPEFTDVPKWCAPAVEWAVAQRITNGVGNNRFAPDGKCTRAQILTFLYRAADEPEAGGELPFQVDEAYQDAILWAAGEGIIDAEDFDPSAPCTRRTAMNYIWQVFGSPEPEAEAGVSFTDVSADAEYAAEVTWAVENGIVEGYTDGTFRPDTVCSRGVIVTLLHRAYVPEARLIVG